MKLIIDISEEVYKQIKGSSTIFRDDEKMCYEAVQNGTPLPEDATNGDVLKMLFPPSVYYGDDEKHIVLLTKDCELTCLNNEWWNAPYKAERENKKENK